MHIGINVIQNTGTGSGMTTYTRGLVETLAARRDHEYVVIAEEGTRRAWEETAAGRLEVASVSHTALRPRTPGQLMKRAAFDAGLTPEARRAAAFTGLGLDLVHHTGDRLSPLRPRLPAVISFFSGNYWAIPGHRIWGSPVAQWAARRSIELSLRRASVVVVPTTYVRDLVVQHARIPSQRVVKATGVSWCGRLRRLASGEGQLDLETRLGLDRPYFLFAAAAHPYKNHDRLLQALRILRSDLGQDALLCLTGTEDPGIAERAVALGVDDAVRLLGFVPEEELANLHTGAVALVHPSLYEAGASYSMFEAMYAGTPVLCSGLGSMLELTGDAALHFDPYEPDDIAGAMRDILVDEGTRRRLVAGAAALLSSYSDEQYGDQIVAAYELAAATRPTP